MLQHPTREPAQAASPPARPRSPGHSQGHSSRRAIGLSLLGAALALLALQVWRPYFFLTNDNFNQVMPVVADMGLRLSRGQSPFLIPELFGGYSLLGDAAALPLWNPIVLLASLLAPLGHPMAVVDAIASAYMLLSTALFALLCCQVRDQPRLCPEGSRSLSDGRIIFLSLSWTFSVFAICIGSSWVTFLANQAALPALMMGLLAARRRSGVLWIAFGTVLGLVAGHMGSFLWGGLAFSVVACAMCVIQKRGEPLLRWAAGNALGLAVLLPLLLPALRAFSGSARSGGFDAAPTFNMSLPLQAISFFLGALPKLTPLTGERGFYLYDLSPWHGFGLLSCLASGAVWHALALRRRQHASANNIAPGGTSPDGALGSGVGLEEHGGEAWRERRMMLALLLAAAVAAAVFASRPGILHRVILALPLLRSLRFPVREVLLVLFWLHVYMALLPVRAPGWFVRATGVLGAAIFGVTLLNAPPPSLGLYKRDRDLMLAGSAQSYWREVAPLLGGRRFIPAADPGLVKLDFPYVLCGAFNFPALFGARSISGAAVPGLRVGGSSQEQPFHYSGLYTPRSRDALLRRDPSLMAITIVHLEPLRIELSDSRSRRLLPAPPRPSFAPRPIAEKAAR